MMCSVLSAYYVEVRLMTSSSGSGNKTWKTEVKGALWDLYAYDETTEGDDDDISVPVNNSSSSYGFEFHGTQYGPDEGDKWAYLNAAVYKITVVITSSPLVERSFFIDMRDPDLEGSGSYDFDIFYSFLNNDEFKLCATGETDTITVEDGEIVRLWEIHDISAVAQDDLDAVSSFQLQYKWHHSGRPYVWYNKRESGDHELWRRIGSGRFDPWVKVQDRDDRFYYLDYDIGPGTDPVYYKVISSNYTSAEISLTGGLQKRQLSPQIMSPEAPIVGNIAYPNPFNPTTNIDFDVISAGEVEISIFNLRGELVETLASEFLPTGHYSKSWNASEMESGIYFCIIRTKENTIKQKLLLTK